ncbi:MAG: 3-hydroxyacyl-CoA dehydrogenase family protein [Anaerolineae bacterium]|nr:3-hydroxyacyl-CoA dehydrogenase family protein [Anaerolineae bacterium]
MSDLAKIAVIGSGLMGHGIAQVFAVAGHSVAVVDPDETTLATVPDRIRANLSRMVAHGVALADDIDAIVGRVRLTPEMADGCDGVAFVTEAVFENMALKQDIFALLDQLCSPETVLCSNTSVMSITEIASKSQYRERIVGTHWWNPPYLIPLVEVVRTEDAAEWAIEATYDLLKHVGKRPVRVQRDVPGFVGNRLQHALWREAFAIIDEGICDAATVDEVVRNSFGLRLPVLGPVENADMVGLDLTLAIHDYILPHLNAAPTPSTTLRERLERGDAGFKTGRGFLEWPDEAITASRERLSNYLLTVQAKR